MFNLNKHLKKGIGITGIEIYLSDFSICRLLRGLAIFDGLFLLAAILAFGLPTLSTWFNDVVFMRIMVCVHHMFSQILIFLFVKYKRFKKMAWIRSNHLQ